MSGLRLAALVLALVGCASAGSGSAPARAPDPANPGGTVGERVYVANQDDGTVSVLDAGTHEVLATVAIGALTGSDHPKPHHVAVEPDGSYWYVSLIGANRVLKLSGEGNRVVGEAVFEAPGMLALDPRSERLYVGRSMSAVNPPRRIGVIDRGTMEVEEIEVLFPRPHAVAVHPDRPLVYTASLAENRLAVVDPVAWNVELGDMAPPAGVTCHTLVQWALSPDGRILVGTGELSGQLLVFDLSDPRRPDLRHTLDVGARPWHPVFTPDGSEVWFANKGANTVTVVDTESWTVEGVVEGDGLAQPHGAAVSGNGRFVFVSSNNLEGTYPGGGTLVVIDRATREIVAVVPVGANAAGVGINARR